jgi:cell division protein FtsL
MIKQLIISILSIAVFISAIEIVIARHDTRKIFVEIQELENARDTLEEEWGRLQLEQSTWATDVRIESLAHSELKMKQPKMHSIVLLKND